MKNSYYLQAWLWSSAQANSFKWQAMPQSFCSVWWSDLPHSNIHKRKILPFLHTLYLKENWLNTFKCTQANKHCKCKEHPWIFIYVDTLGHQAQLGNANNIPEHFLTCSPSTGTCRHIRTLNIRICAQRYQLGVGLSSTRNVPECSVKVTAGWVTCSLCAEPDLHFSWAILYQNASLCCHLKALGNKEWPQASSGLMTRLP